MALEKTVSIDKIEVVDIGIVQVRAKTVITEDGQEISTTFHRSIIVPGQDTSDQDARVKAICAVVHTPDVIAKYQEREAQKQAEMKALQDAINAGA